MRHAQLLGAARAADVAAGAGAGARDGPGLSGAGARRGADHRDAEARGDAASARRWRAAWRCSTTRPTIVAARRPARRRDRLQALRHLRLPARPDRRMRCASAASRVDHRRLRRRHGAPEGRGARAAGRAPARRRPRPSGSRCASATGATEFLGYDTEQAEGDRSRRWSTTAVRSTGPQPARRSASSSTRRRSMANPAARWATPARSPAKGFRIEVTDTQKKADGLFVHVGQVVKGDGRGPALPSSSRSIMRAARGCAPTIRPRISCTRRCAKCWAPMSRRRARWSRPTGCASTSRIPSRSRPTSSTRSRRCANEIVVQNSAGDDAADGGRRCHRRGRHGAVRREIRRRGAGRLDGHGTAATRPASRISVELCGGTHVGATGDIGLVRLVAEGAVAAGVRRIEALTGEAARRHLDEQERAAEGDRCGAQGGAGRRAGACRGAGRGAPQARARARRGAQEAGAGRRRGGGCRPKPRPSPASASSAAASRGVSPKDLKPLADAGKKSLGSGVVVFVGAGDDGKASVVVGVTDDLTGASAPSIWFAARQPRSAARAAAAGPTWPRPAAPTRRRPAPRSRR